MTSSDDLHIRAYGVVDDALLTQRSMMRSQLAVYNATTKKTSVHNVTDELKIGACKTSADAKITPSIRQDLKQRRTDRLLVNASGNYSNNGPTRFLALLILVLHLFQLKNIRLIVMLSWQTLQ